MNGLAKTYDNIVEKVLSIIIPQYTIIINGSPTPKAKPSKYRISTRAFVILAKRSKEKKFSL
jgi:hypothetical protein